MIRVSRPGPRVALLAVVATVLLALVGSSVAQASAVKLTTRLKPFTTSQSRCTSQSAAVTNVAVGGATSTVLLSNLDVANCRGKALVVTVYDPKVTTWPAARRLEVTRTVESATATLSAAPATFVPAAGLKVRVTIGGWQVPATWTYAPPLPLITCTVPGSSATCTATAAGGNIWDSNFIGTVSVTSTSRTPVKWRLTMNLSDVTTLPFLPKALRDVQGGLVLVSASDCSAVPRIVVVEGTTTWGQYDTVWAGQTRSVQVQGHATAQTGTLLLSCP
jgi:hypothetical protein